MRRKEFALVVQNKTVRIFLLAKMDRKISPRDANKFREKLENVVHYLGAKRPLDPLHVYEQLLPAVHPSQKDGMGKEAS